MHVVRKDGNEITLSEEKIVLELICRTYRYLCYGVMKSLTHIEFTSLR